MPMPDYSIRGVPQLQQQQGPLGALTEFAKGEALSRGLDAAFPGAGLAKDAASAVLPTLLQKGGSVHGPLHPEAKADMKMHSAHLMQEGGQVPWWKAAARKVIGEDNDRIQAERKAARKHLREQAKKNQGPSKGDVGSVVASLLGAGFFKGGGYAKPMYQRMGGMTPGPLGMSDMLAAGKGKDVSKVVYKKKGGDIEDTMEIAYHAPLAAKPKSGE